MTTVSSLFDQGLVWKTGKQDTGKSEPCTKDDTASKTANANGSVTGANTSATGASFKRSQDYLATFGIEEIDRALPCNGLAFGCLHQWSLTHALTSKDKHRWHAPLFLISTLLGKALGAMPYSTNPVAHGKSMVAWIGKRCWPTPQLLEQNITWQSEIASGGEVSWPWKSRSVFINPQSKDARLWSAVQALKNPSVFAVVADCSGFDLHAMRRLQLAAEFGNTLGLMVRPPWEEQMPSAAHTKWRVSPLRSEEGHLAWNLELVLAKGVASMEHQLSKRLQEKLSTGSDVTNTQHAPHTYTQHTQYKPSAAASRKNAAADGPSTPLSSLLFPTTSVCSSEVVSMNKKVSAQTVSAPAKRNQWLIEWNEESHYGKGSLCIAPPPAGERAGTGETGTATAGSGNSPEAIPRSTRAVSKTA